MNRTASAVRPLLVGAVLISSLPCVTASGDVFPGRPRNRSIGAHDAIYMMLRGANDTPLDQRRESEIRDSEERTRQFYAANSGGAYEVQYEHILDVVIPLNLDGTRQGGWFEAAEQYVRDNYGIEPEDYHLNVFDVSGTVADPGQGWSGISVSPGNNIALQADVDTNWGQTVVDHELGHRIGVPHSGAYRAVKDDNYTPYIWNDSLGDYQFYNANRQGWVAAPFGVHNDEYGSPFVVMGNISRGDHTVHQKRTTLKWLDSNQVPNLRTLDEGTFRIYAHDELEAVYSDTREVWGVEETFDANSLYGLTYDRIAERYNPSTRRFESYTQTLTLEYRAGRDGLLFEMGDVLLDMDLEGGANRNNLERELEVGQSVRGIDFATSFFSAGEGVDFLDSNPPPPTDPWDVLSDWFEFTILDVASDAIGSYIEVAIALESYAIETALVGDLNTDGVIDTLDWYVFTANTHTDFLGETITDAFLRGDLDRDWDNDYDDFLLFKDAFISANSEAAFYELLRIPEPSSLVTLGLGLFATTLFSRDKPTSRR